MVVSLRRFYDCKAKSAEGEGGQAMTVNPCAESLSVVWRPEIDSLCFQPDQHGGLCVIHRLAFRTLLGFDPAPGECQALFSREHKAFREAARAKIIRRALGPDARFHLTSRDILRAMAPDPAASSLSA
jgi:hypothetical protein